MPSQILLRTSATRLLAASATGLSLLAWSPRATAQSNDSIQCGDDVACQVLVERLGSGLGPLKITKGALLYDVTDPNEKQLSDSGCSHKVVQQSARVTGTLETDQLLDLRGNPFTDTLVGAVRLPVTARAEVRVRETLGLRTLFGCTQLARDSYTGSGAIGTTAQLALGLQLNSRVARTDAGLTVTIRPNLGVLFQLEDTELDVHISGRSPITSLINTVLLLPRITGSVTDDILHGNSLEGTLRSAGNAFLIDGVIGPLLPFVNVSDALFGDLFADYLEDRANDRLRDRAGTVEADLNAQLRAALGTNELGERTFVLDAAALRDVALSGLKEQLGPLALAVLLSSPTFQTFLEQSAPELAARVITRDEEGLLGLLATGAVCDLLRPTLASMTTPALFQRAGNTCRAADVLGADAESYFQDAACTEPVAFRPRPMADYCAELVSQGPALGDGSGWTPDLAQPGDPLPSVPSREWTINPGTMLPASVEPVTGKRVPFMKQVRYRTLQPIGCSLEMRVYKSDIAARGLRPMIALHGGGWVFRGAAYMGLEAQIAHFTNAGFVVFAPFYRLSSDDDGNPECQNATAQEIVSDAEAAFEWVTANARAFGADLGKPVVFGQSAGAHLATQLLVSHPREIDRALLLYAPTDVELYLSELRNDPEVASDGERFLRDFLDIQDLSGIDPNDPPAIVLQNSFHDQVTLGLTPPVFMIHGSADTTVPVSQSEGLCTALGGTGASVRTAAGTEFGCGRNGSTLVVVNGGDHALDVCLEARLTGTAGIPDLALPICPAGPAGQRAASKAALQQALAFLGSSAASAPPPAPAAMFGNDAADAAKQARGVAPASDLAALAP